MAKNDPKRGYALNPFYSELLKKLDVMPLEQWTEYVHNKLNETGKQQVKELLSSERNIAKIAVKLPSGQELNLSLGEHNILQKAIIEEFLPRYGFGCEVLYIGDTADRFLYKNDEKLQELQFFELLRGELPDIVAYSESRNWLYLIEAVYSSGPITDVRLFELKKLTEACTADIVFITAFLDKKTLRKFILKT